MLTWTNGNVSTLHHSPAFTALGRKVNAWFHVPDKRGTFKPTSRAISIHSSGLGVVELFSESRGANDGFAMVCIKERWRAYWARHLRSLVYAFLFLRRRIH